MPSEIEVIEKLIARSELDQQRLTDLLTKHVDKTEDLFDEMTKDVIRMSHTVTQIDGNLTDITKSHYDTREKNRVLFDSHDRRIERLEESSGYSKHIKNVFVERIIWVVVSTLLIGLFAAAGYGLFMKLVDQ